jgi:hypothetical protein
MLKHLETDKHFRVENLDNLDDQIPAFIWCLLTRARGKSGDIECPHQQSFARIREVESWPTAYLFRIAGRNRLRNTL